MAFTVAIEVEHLPSACVSPALHTAKQLQTLLIPNVNPRASVKSALKKFIRENLDIADDLQSISAPLFSLLPEELGVEDICSRYCCHAEAENPDLHVDEDSFAFFGRERGKFVELCDDDRLDQRHIIDECKLNLKRLPQKLPEQGGRIFVEMKNGILPLLGISPRTAVSHVKKILETMLGIPVSQQLLSSVGRVMHDEFFIEDFEGLHAIYEDSVLDLCKSGDTNAEQAHRRMAVQISINGGENEFTLVVQGRDAIRSVMQTVESRTGYAQWQQRVLFSGKALDEKKMMSDYFIYPECTLQVNIFKNPSKSALRTADSSLQNQTEPAMDMEAKPMARKLKLVRTMKGMVMGTLTIPVLMTDKIFDVKRKLKRFLQPLVERNLSMHSPIREPRHIDITPRSSSASKSVGNMKPSRFVGSVHSPTSSDERMKSMARNFSTSGSLKNGGFVNSPSRTAARSCLSTESSPLGHPKTPNSILSPSEPQFKDSNVGQGNKLISARRLQFESMEHGSSMASEMCRDESNTDIRSIGTGKLAVQEGVKVEKRSLGAWINNSVHALTEQIRAQLIEN
eukprot:c2429_g1_i1 orf=89-1792(+)